MKVRDAKERLENLKTIYDNALKIQECCLRNEEAKETILNLEEKAGISLPLRTFVSSVAAFAADERKRISNLIDNADIKID